MIIKKCIPRASYYYILSIIIILVHQLHIICNLESSLCVLRCKAFNKLITNCEIAITT